MTNTKNYKIIRVCCICQDFFDYHNHKWYHPSAKERRDNFLKGIEYTHGLCPTDYMLQCRMMGINPREETIDIHLKHGKTK